MNRRTLLCPCNTWRIVLWLSFSSHIQLCFSSPIDRYNGIHTRDGEMELFSALEIQLEKTLTRLKDYMHLLDAPLAEDVEFAFRDDGASYPEVVQKSVSYPEIAAKSDMFWEFE